MYVMRTNLQYMHACTWLTTSVLNSHRIMFRHKIRREDRATIMRTEHPAGPCARNAACGSMFFLCSHMGFARVDVMTEATHWPPRAAAHGAAATAHDIRRACLTAFCSRRPRLGRPIPCRGASLALQSLTRLLYVAYSSCWCAAGRSFMYILALVASCLIVRVRAVPSECSRDATP